MAFLRTATAIVVHPRASTGGWSKTRTAAKVTGQPDRGLVAQATEILGKAFDPKDYLLTHATIVASVDVETVPGVKLGSVKEGGKKINRKYADYRITAETDQYINNNFDSFSREVLLKSYRTFIGAHNFLEHVQVEDLSKGRIIDAVARDIGDSVYVDILIATDRKHTDLVDDIESGRLTTLSMGCFLPGTMVTMADGVRVPIEEVQPGDMVLTHKGRAREVLNKQIRGGSWGMQRIQVHGVPTDIVATDNHPFFVYRPASTCGCGCGAPLPEHKPSKGKARASSGRRLGRRFLRGHANRVFNPNNTYSLDEHRQRQARLADIQALRMEEVRADDLRVGDFVCFPRALANGADAHGKARLLGYFLAEGSFLKRDGVPVEVQFNFSMAEKETYVAEVMDLLRQEFPDANRPWAQDRPGRSTCTVHISGRDVASWFFTHGGEYSHAKRLSPEAMGWSIESHLRLIGAWINGDGTLTQSGATSGTTTSYALACQMQALMARCGLHSRMECAVAGRSMDIREVVNGGVVVRDESTGKLPAITLIMGQTDAQPLQGHCAKVREVPTFAGRTLRLTDDHIIYQISSIVAESYEGWVHNMEVAEDHSYIVEGVAVHNCSTEETTCTKCGNVAVDETELCDCVKYAKGNVFLDERGKRHRIAEICGHPTLDPNGGVTFIEGSWVASPAFTGAVMRNIISPDSLSAKAARQVQEILSVPPAQWVAPTSGQQKAASEAELILAQAAIVGRVSDRAAAGFDFGDPAADEGGDTPPADKPAPSKLDDLEDRVMDAVVDRVFRRVKDDLSKGDKKLNPEDSTAAGNDSLNRLGRADLRKVARQAYTASVDAIVRTASCDADVVNRVAALDQSFGFQTPVDVYRAALVAGPLSKYSSTESYINACRGALNGGLGPKEAAACVRLGRILSYAETSLRPSTTPKSVRSRP